MHGAEACRVAVYIPTEVYVCVVEQFAGGFPAHVPLVLDCPSPKLIEIATVGPETYANVTVSGALPDVGEAEKLTTVGGGGNVVDTHFSPVTAL